MEIHQLRAFVAVAEELHFGRAAQRLFMAQPPLSRTVQQLERELGCRLFERTTRSVRLTAEGEALLEPAREMLELSRTAHEAVRSAGRGETGRVRLGFAGPSSHTLVARLARLVREERPLLDLTLVSSTFGVDALAQVVGGTLDLALARWEVAPPGIASRVVRVERPVLAVPAGHPLADRVEVGFADLAGVPLVALPPGSLMRERLILGCFEAGFAPDVVQVASDSWTILAMVAAGVGATLSLDSAVEHARLDDVVVLPFVSDQDPVLARLAWRSDDVRPAVREVLRLSERALPDPG